jgi:DNA-directed RNA polymerase
MEDTMRPLADKVALGTLEAHPYNQLTERKDKETGETRMEWDGGYTCAATMAAHVYKAVTTVAAKADEASTWIRAVAATLAHEGLSMTWRTPTGFPVVQRYAEYTSKRVNLWLYGRDVTVPTSTDKIDAEGNVLERIQLLIRQAPTSRVDKNAMRNASSPNVIHSMDAAHLHKAVAYAKAAGIDSFSMIHDSFGTHMGHMEQFNGLIREALIDCYKDYCPLEEIDRQARAILSAEGQEKLPPIPAKGNLDLEAIRNAVFAFA